MDLLYLRAKDIHDQQIAHWSEDADEGDAKTGRLAIDGVTLGAMTRNPDVMKVSGKGFVERDLATARRDFGNRHLHTSTVFAETALQNPAREKYYDGAARRQAQNCATFL